MTPPEVESQQGCGFLKRVSLQGDPSDESLVRLVKLRQAPFDVDAESDFVFEGGQGVVGGVAAEELAAHERGRAARLGGQALIAAKHGFGVFAIKREFGFGWFWLLFCENFAFCSGWLRLSRKLRGVGDRPDARHGDGTAGGGLAKLRCPNV